MSQQKRVKTLLERHGNDFFSRIGRKGFEATVRKHFGGDREAAIRWLIRTGQWAIDKDLSYHKPSIWRGTWEHPAKIGERGEWLAYVREAIEPNFPPFSIDATDIT